MHAALSKRMTAKRGAKVIARSSSFDHPQARLTEFIQAHPFNHQLEVLLPQLKDKNERNQLFQSLGYFLAVRAKLSAFLERSILNHIAADGVGFQALAVNSDADRSSSVAITPDCTVRMRLRCEAYRRFGLVGRQSSVEADTFCIQVQLKSPNFLSGGSHYLRVLDCFESRTQPVDLLCAAQQGVRDLAGLLTALSGVSFAKQCQNEYHSSTKSTHVPHLEQLCRQEAAAGITAKSKVQSAQLEQALECLGRLSVGAEGRYPTPTAGRVGTLPTEVMKTAFAALDEVGLGLHRVQLERHCWSGFILPQQVLRCVEEARTAMREGQCPWAAVVVRGFVDTPVSWSGTEHAKDGRLGGENDYAFLLLPDQQFVSFILSGAGDEYQRT